MKHLYSFVFIFLSVALFGQTNMSVTNTLADQYLHGNYDPSSITSGESILPSEFATRVNADINPDSLKAYIFRLASFKNRNTGSDTVSSIYGIGAARRWVDSKFKEFAATNTRLQPAYFQFDQLICEAAQHRNILSVLPGTDTTDKSIIVVEGHIDSRCADVCDTACIAQGVEDNATGTALVMELARVLSQYKLKRTILFAVVIGEEQGLFGANALSTYIKSEGINVRAVFNNDVIGGVICGKTASPPGCDGENTIDSTRIRIFSSGTFNSISKSLARWSKLQYTDDLIPIVSVPMELAIMSGEDRAGRGGDHIPFRQDGFAALRYCASNEHGNASNGSDYTDRQHTESDVLGVDTDGDMMIDSFFVDFNYLARNTVINGVSASAASNGLLAPTIEVEQTDDAMIATITPTQEGTSYKIGIRTESNDFDTLIETTELVNTLEKIGDRFMFFSACTVDEFGIESLFSEEVRVRVTTGIEAFDQPQSGITLLSNKPNPFDEATTIFFEAQPRWQGKKANVLVTDIHGKQIKNIPITMQAGMNEVLYEHGFKVVGTFYYSLVVDNTILETNAMVFAN